MYKTLEKVPLFADLTAEELQRLWQCAALRNFPRHAIIINEGDLTDSLYVIVEGKVRVFLQDEQGKEVTLNFQGAGECFGELALLDERPRSASVQTVEPSRFAIISKADFMRCLTEHPHMAITIIRYLSRRMRALTENVRSLALMDVYGRVARTLLNLAEQQGDYLVVKERFTQQELANMVGASREMVTRILKDLVTGGYIEIEDRRITIKNRLPADW